MRELCDDGLGAKRVSFRIPTQNPVRRFPERRFRPTSGLPTTRKLPVNTAPLQKTWVVSIGSNFLERLALRYQFRCSVENISATFRRFSSGLTEEETLRFGVDLGMNQLPGV